MTANKPDDVVNTSHCVSYFKRSAVDKGYYEDAYIKLFSSPYVSLPALDMWIFIRTTTLRKLITSFMEQFQNEKVQFVDLGCGLSTLSLYLLDKYKNVVCYDLDFRDHLRYKAKQLDESNQLHWLNYKLADGLLVSENYKMVHMDFEDVEEVYRMEEHGIARNLPTFFLSEFCLTYVENEKSDKVIKFLSEFSTRPSAYAFLDYVGSWTKFGKWYSKVFDDYGAEFKSFRKYDTVEKHEKRHTDLGWDFAMVNPMSFTFNEVLTNEDRERALKSDNFIDFDEAATFCNHTVIGAAVKHTEELSKILELYDRRKYPESDSTNSHQILPYNKGFDPEDFNLNYFKKMLSSFIRDSNSGDR